MLRGTSDYGEPYAGRRSRPGDYDDYYDYRRDSADWRDNAPPSERGTRDAMDYNYYGYRGWHSPDAEYEMARARGW